MNNLKNRITFSDYDEEGLFVYNLSKLENKNPYLICMVEENECYVDYKIDSSELEDNVWFLEYTKKLKEICAFNFLVNKYFSIEYIIYEITDKQAYMNIWSMASRDFSIAQFTISGNCSMKKIIESIKATKYHGGIHFDLNLAPWAYTQNYGGGSDEHYAVFYSENEEYIEYIKKQVNSSKTSNLTRV